jgi:diguanylate cyclase (GGDEF)-like protein
VRGLRVRTRLTLAFAVPVAALALSAFGVFQADRRRELAEDQVTRTSNTVRRAIEILKTAVDAETGERGFAITADDAFLSPYRQAVAAFDHAVWELDDLVGDNPEQRRRVAELGAEFHRWRNEVAEPVIAVTRQGELGMNAARALIKSGRGKSVLDHIRITSGKIIETEEGLLRAAQGRAMEARSLATAFLVAAAGVLLVAIAVAYRIALAIARKAALVASTADKIAGGDLTVRAPVAAGQDELDATGQALNRMAERLDSRARESDQMSRLREVLEVCKDMDEVRGAVGRLGPRIIGVDRGELFLLNASRTVLLRDLAWGDALSQSQSTLEECWALRRGQPHHYDGPDGDVLPCPHLLEQDLATTCIPLAAQGETLGFFCLRGLGEGERRGDQLRVATVMAEILSLTAANLRLRTSLHEQAIRDPLTGLYNRRFLEEGATREMIRAARSKQPMSLVALDVDHFKKFNDTHGHPAGDALLRELAARLSSAFRASDILCRIGGEEFAALLPDCSLENAAMRAEAVRAAVRSIVVQVNGSPIGGISVSLGIAVYPDHGANLAGLLSMADQALYRSKRDGRDRVTIAASERSATATA